MCEQRWGGCSIPQINLPDHRRQTPSLLQRCQVIVKHAVTVTHNVSSVIFSVGVYRWAGYWILRFKFSTHATLKIKKRDITFCTTDAGQRANRAEKICGYKKIIIIGRREFCNIKLCIFIYFFTSDICFSLSSVSFCLFGPRGKRRWKNLRRKNKKIAENVKKPYGETQTALYITFTYWKLLKRKRKEVKKQTHQMPKNISSWIRRDNDMVTMRKWNI